MYPAMGDLRAGTAPVRPYEPFCAPERPCESNSSQPPH